MPDIVLNDNSFNPGNGNRVNSLAPGRCGSDFACVISEHMLRIQLISITNKIAKEHP